MHTLARELGKFVHEIEGMPIEEYDDWMAFFSVEAEERERNRKKGRK